MQFPFAVSFTEPDGTTRRYTVQANDSQQAKRRARRLYDTDRPRGTVGDIGRTMRLTPRQTDAGRFLPCIDNAVLPVPSCESERAAVEAALAFVEQASNR